MANKEKILATAQKYLQKNNLSRAVKEYAKVVELDGKDVRSRQKLAELYSRTGQIEDALKQYEVVAGYYADNTFYLKAIAVYKQMQKLAPDNPAYTLKLAKLNEQQGLIGNALSEYRILLKGYEESQQSEEAVKILTRMRGLDPDNVTIGMRIAEFYARNGDEALARREFEAVEAKLQQLADYKQLHKFYEHFMALWPADLSVQLGLGCAMVDYGDAVAGTQYLTRLQRQHPQNASVLFALARGFRNSSEFGNELECYQRLVGWEPENLTYQLGLYQAALDAGDPAQVLTRIETAKDLFFAAERVAEIKPFYEQLRQVMPEDRTVLTSLHAIYEHLGEGERLFDILSVEEDHSLAGGAEFGTISFPQSGSDLQFDDAAAFEELEFGAAVDAGDSSGQDISFDDISFDLVGDDSADSGSIVVDSSQRPVRQPASSSVNIQTDLEEADFYLQQGLLEEATQVCDRLALGDPDNAEVKKRQELIRKRQGDKVAVPAADVSQLMPKSKAVPKEDMSDFDFDSELTLDLDDADFADSAKFDFNGDDELEKSLALSLNPDAGDPVKDGPELADSQRGVVTVITDDDTESSYNLGIAYKEMGLLEDAILEFAKAERNPDRKVDCLLLKADCLIAQQKFEAAEEMLTIGLSDRALTSKDRVVIYYQTGLLYEAWNRYSDALSSYQVVADNDVTFRDVRSKINELKELVDDGGGSFESNRVSYL